MGRILAIDYGQKRVGLAVTDELQMIAHNLDMVHSKDVLAYLANYINNNKVDAFVVGEPKQMNNTPSESAVYVNAFIKQLAKKFPEMEIIRIDERFTSKMAFQTMIDAGLHKKDRQNKGLVDSISATIILQTYLEMKANQ